MMIRCRRGSLTLYGSDRNREAPHPPADKLPTCVSSRAGATCAPAAVSRLQPTQLLIDLRVSFVTSPLAAAFRVELLTGWRASLMLTFNYKHRQEREEQLNHMFPCDPSLTLLSSCSLQFHSFLLTRITSAKEVMSSPLSIWLFAEYRKLLDRLLQNVEGCIINQSIKFYLYSPYSQTTVRLIGL